MDHLLDPIRTDVWLPDRKLLTPLFRPEPDQLPPGRAKCIVFDFPGITTFATVERDITLQSDFVIWGLSASTITNAPPLNANTSLFRVQLLHHHVGAIRRLFDIHQQDVNSVLGTSATILGQAFAGKSLLVLKNTYPLKSGDSVTCEVRTNSAQASVGVQVCLHCVELD